MKPCEDLAPWTILAVNNNIPARAIKLLALRLLILPLILRLAFLLDIANCLFDISAVDMEGLIDLAAEKNFRASRACTRC